MENEIHWYVNNWSQRSSSISFYQVVANNYVFCWTLVKIYGSSENNVLSIFVYFWFFCFQVFFNKTGSTFSLLSLLFLIIAIWRIEAKTEKLFQCNNKAIFSCNYTRICAKIYLSIYLSICLYVSIYIYTYLYIYIYKYRAT